MNTGKILGHGLAIFEYRRTSRLKLIGLPLYDIWFGRDPANPKGPATAKGVLAVGYVAKGVVAMGHVASGCLTFGILSVGVLAFGVITTGLLGVGVINLALVAATGAISLAPHAFGVVAVGSTASGLFALGLEILDATQTLKIAIAPLIILAPLGALLEYLPVLLMARSRREHSVLVRSVMSLGIASTGAMVGCFGSSFWYVGPQSLLILIPTFGLSGLAGILTVRLNRLSRLLFESLKES